MPVSSTDLTVVGSSTNSYEAINHYVGQVASFLASFPGASIVYDNNSLPNNQRFIHIQIGSNPHRILVGANSYTAILVALRNAANTTNLINLASWTMAPVTLTGYYNSNNAIVRNITNSIWVAAYSILSDNSTALIRDCQALNQMYWTSDTKYPSIVGPYYNYDANGKYTLTPAKYQISGSNRVSTVIAPVDVFIFHNLNTWSSGTRVSDGVSTYVVVGYSTPNELWKI